MSEAAASSGGVTPQPINPIAGARGQHRMTSESFMDSFDDLSADLAEESAPEPEARPRPKRERPGKEAAERQETPEEMLDEEIQAAEPDAEAEVDDLAPEEEEEASLLPQGKGSREDPLTLKDLPKDKFVEVKIDGKKVVVDLAEALTGTFMRPEYLHRQVNFVKGELEKAKQIASRAVQSQETFQSNWTGLLKSPEALLGYLLDDAESEEVLEHVAFGFAKIRKAELANPELRLRRVRARDQRLLDKRKEELDSREQNERTTRENTQKVAQLHATWRPGFEAGLKAAGFPEWSAELADEVGVRLERIRRKNGSITADDWEAVIPVAAKSIGAKPASAPARRPAPAPRAAPRPATAPPRRAGAAPDFDAMPHNQKLRDHRFFWR